MPDKKYIMFDVVVPEHDFLSPSIEEVKEYCDFHQIDYRFMRAYPAQDKWDEDDEDEERIPSYHNAEK